MVKLYLPGHSRGSERSQIRGIQAPVYIDYQRSHTEERIESQLQQLGLGFETRELNLEGFDTRGGLHPNNMGYTINVIDDQRYMGVGAWYGRWTDIGCEMPIAEALKQLADDSQVFQSLTYLLGEDGREIGLEVFRLGAVDVRVDLDDEKSLEIRDSLIRKFSESYIVAEEHPGESLQFLQFAVPL
jgi:hypothetical protein